MSIKKKFLKSKPVCKVTFKVSKEVADGATAVHLVGDFNGWSLESDPMKPLRDGSFTCTLDLESGRDYQFRYLIAGTFWANDPEADGEAPTPFADATNSLLKL